MALLFDREVGPRSAAFPSPFSTRYEIACLEYIETQHDAAVAAAAGSILP